MARRLEDLFVTGRTLTFEPDSDDPVTVWINKLNPVQHKQAVERANIKRAKARSVKRLPQDHEEKLVLLDEITEMLPSRSDMVEFLSADKVNQKRMSAQEEIAANEEWSENNLLDELRDAWEAGLRDAVHDEDHPDYEKAKQVFEDLKRFTDEVEKVVEKESKSILREYASTSEEKLREQCLDQYIDRKSDIEWLTEFKMCEVWFSLRDNSDHNKLLYEDREGVNNLPIEIVSRVQETLQEINVEPTEGKE